MAKTKRVVADQEKMTTKLRITVPKAQSLPDKPDTKEGIVKSDSESPLSPSLIATKTPRPPTKRKVTNGGRAASSPTSPIITSSSATTPQPEPSSKRKGGNKRKFTHEYCLTCTRYGRACGGRRENEDGCAVCRDPDRSKGEKLRECLWADPEAGINDYKTARELFKKAQAEARAQRAKPTTKRQRSDAALQYPPISQYSSKTSDSLMQAEKLPQTSKPLNLLPPTRSGSSYESHPARYAQFYEDEPDNIEEPRSASNTSAIGATLDQAPRIHRPQLSYIRVDSETGDYVTAASQSSCVFLPPQFRKEGPPNISPCYWDPVYRSWYRSDIHSTHQRAPLQYTPVYRSAYDAPPAPPIYVSQPVRTGQHFVAPPGGTSNIQNSGSPLSTPLDKSGTPPRKWSTNGRKITSIDGTEWNSRAWKPANNASHIGNSEDAVNKYKIGMVTTEGISDTSSLSTCLSMDGEVADDVAANAAVAENGAKLRLRLGTQSSFKKLNTFTLPGEITIEDDEDNGTSGSDDTELSSDESKHKTLPAKLRKILSRSRVTKVIIEGDIFEIRPRSKIPSSKVQKKSSTVDSTLRNGSGGKSYKRDQRRVSQLPSAESEDVIDGHELDDVLTTKSKTQGVQSKPAPIKIKLIFNRKTAVALPEKAQDKHESRGADQIEARPLIPTEDNEMDESWQRTP